MPRVLFLLAALAFTTSLFVTWDDDNPGWHTFGTAAWYSVAGLWEVARDPRAMALLIPMILVTFANLTLIATAVLGGKLGRRHSMPMLLLSANGLLAALLAPAFLAPVLITFTGSVSPVEVYAELPFAYWLWIASFALVSAGWACIVWNQREMRNAAINAMTTTTPPRSGESSANDKHGG